MYVSGNSSGGLYCCIAEERGVVLAGPHAAEPSPLFWKEGWLIVGTLSFSAWHGGTIVSCVSSLWDTWPIPYYIYFLTNKTFWVSVPSIGITIPVRRHQTHITKSLNFTLTIFIHLYNWTGQNHTDPRHRSPWEVNPKYPDHPLVVECSNTIKLKTKITILSSTFPPQRQFVCSSVTFIYFT